ncbi:MAG TPA: HlyD family efflux transporter periplasmic adaptor subunit [Polyangiaceae bacterium]
MIKNHGAVAGSARSLSRVLCGVVMLAGACQLPRAEPNEELYQGVAELDDRQLAFEVSGRVTSLVVHEGDVVKQGALLATVDDALDEQQRAARDLEARAAHAQSKLVDKGVRPEEITATRAKLRAARSSEELSKRQMDRERDLNARGVTPAAQLDELEGRYARAVAEREALESVLAEQVRGARPEEREVARARADAAQAAVALDDLRIERRELRAPADGVVLDVHADPGEVISPGAPVVTVADPGRIYAEVFVPQGKLTGIDVGDRASIRADGLRAPLGGRVEHVARRTEFTPRYLFSERERPNLVVRVKVRIDDPKALLHAGVPVFVSIAR